MKITATLTGLFLAMSALAQNSSVEFSLAAGIKRNIFQTTKSDIIAFNLTPGYDLSLITPVIRNTISFFTFLKTAKKVSNRFSIFNSIGLDMQQLSIESGFKMRAPTAGVTSFSRNNSSALLPRLKVNFGLDYLLTSGTKNKLAIGFDGGEMLNLSAEGYSYTFIGVNISFQTKNITLFASGSLTPYNISLPNMENYIGNLNATIFGSFEYRIYDLSFGTAIKL